MLLAHSLSVGRVCVWTQNVSDNTFAEFHRSSGAEEKVTKLQEALKEVQNTHIKEVDEMNTQLERQRQRTEELTEAVSQHLRRLCTGSLVSRAVWY